MSIAAKPSPHNQQENSMTDAIFNQTVTINKSNTVTMFSVDGQSFKRALLEFTFGMSKFQAHLTPEEATHLATVLNDAADWIESEASRKQAGDEQAARDKVACGERYCDDTRDLPSVAELDQFSQRQVRAQLTEAA